MVPSADVRVGGRSGKSQYQFTLWGSDVDELQRVVPTFAAAKRRCTCPLSHQRVRATVRAEAITRAESVERREAMIDLGQVGRHVVRGLEPALLVRGDGAMLHQRAASRPDRLAGRRT